MSTYWLYLFKVNISLIVFYVFFIVVFRRYSFFLLNRIFLLSCLILSFILPALKISIFSAHPNAVFNLAYLNLDESGFDIFQPQTITHESTGLNFKLILSVIYFAGILLIFFRLLFSIFRIKRIKSNSAITRIGKIPLVKTEMKKPFSFFNVMFLPTQENNPMIMMHEMAHIRQLHWVDLLLGELATVILWFNPVIFLYKNSIRLQHEFLADNYVIRNKFQIENYLISMMEQVQVVAPVGIVSHFQGKTLKKRINMITKNKTSIKYLGFYVLLIPLVILMSFAFNANNYKTIINPGNGPGQTDGEYIPSIYPVDISKVTHISGYGERINPFTKKKDFHYAVDLATNEGEKVVSTAKGVVLKAENDKKPGNYIIIKHNEIYTTIYEHLKSIEVKPGELVEKGQLIGYVGNSGLSTGPHLHYGVFKNGEKVNPEDYFPKIDLK